MADTQIATSGPEGSLPPTLINPDTTGGLLPQQQPTLVSKLSPPTGSLPQSAFDPVVANLGPKPAPTPAPTVQPSPTTAPAVAPPPAAAPAAPAQPGQQAPRYVAVGDSLAAGIAQTRKFNQTYEVKDDPAAKANPAILAASGRTTDQTLAQINANPKQYAGADVLLSTGMSNDLMGGRSIDDAMTNVASQLDALRAAGANVALAGVGSGVPGYQQANARLAQIAKAYNIPFTGEPATTQGGRVHPHDYNAFYGQFHFGEQPQQQPPTPGTGKTISDATDYIQHSEGGGPYVLYGGQTYDPRAVPTKPGYYGFPDWAGGHGPDGRETHAAGGAQWEPDTWKTAVEGFSQAGLAAQLGHTPDFRNPDDQKAVFNYWAARRYREETGRDIVADMNAGHVDWGALGSEWSSLKYAGGGNTGMTVSNLPGYQNWQRSIEGQRQTLQDESADLQRRMKDLEAGDPEQRALADQLLKKQIQLMDTYENMIAHPPTQKPHDMIGNFGSIATLIGIFAGRFAHRPMVASLNAAGAAMQAMNDNDYEAYQNAFKTWKTQADMTSNLMTMESNTYKGIMDDRRLTMEEKFKEMDASAKIFQNRLLSQQLEAGEYEKAWEYAQKLDKAKDDHDLVQAQIEEAHAKVEKDRSEAQFPLLGPAGQERSDLMTELQKKADEEAKNPTPGQKPRTAEELAKDADEVQAARQRIELRKKDKPADDVQSPLLPTTGEDRSAIITELGIQATADVKKSNPDASPADAAALVKKRVQELATNYAAVDAARTKVAEQKGILRQGGTINDDDALIRAGQLMKGDTSGMIRLNQASRDKVYDAYQKLVMPQIESEFQKEEGHAPSEAERKNLLLQLGVQLATSKADFTGFTQYQRSLAIRQATIDTAVDEARRAIKVARDMSNKVPRTDFPAVNSWLLTGKYQTGNTDVVKLVGATDTLLNNYSRAVTPTGQATDMVRGIAREQLAKAQSQDQYNAALDMMDLEMSNAQAAPEEVRVRRREDFMRSGTYQPDTPFLQHGVTGAPPAPPPPTVTPQGGSTYPTPPPEAVRDLKANPGTSSQFEQIFGPGSAARALGQ